MAKHIPYIVFVQDPETKAVLERVLCDTKDEADGAETEMVAEWSSYGELPDIFVERIDSEKVHRAFGADVQQRLLQEARQPGRVNPAHSR